MPPLYQVLQSYSSIFCLGREVIFFSLNVCMEKRVHCVAIDKEQEKIPLKSLISEEFWQQLIIVIRFQIVSQGFTRI